MLKLPDQQSLIDIESIKYLKAYYGKYADEKYTADHQRKPQEEIDRLAWLQSGVFTDDAIWDGGAFGVLEGRQAIYDNLRTGPWSFGAHYYVSPLIEVDGNKATGRWVLWQVGTLTRENTPIILSAVTEDEYRRTDEGWRLSKMRQTTKFMTRHDVPWSVNRNAPFTF
ncbi:nuclear transport factor 2 family protein [Pseudochelatococcus sp. G4_1912]|uniref:nuclear transport factor 2 family protein n=1 Tax=Pseudochelatococcus sp. G4_1912 TaxID=3114288 RepID=UPI0039C6FAA6